MDKQDYLQHLINAGEEDVQLTPKQAKILEAAIEIFAEKGYAATSTSEIAKKAGVAEGTIFRHYKTKKELLISIVTPGIIKLTVPFFADQFVSEVFKERSESYEQLLRKIIRNRFEFVQKNVPLLKIIIQEMAFHEELKQSFQSIFIKKIFPKFDEAVTQFKKDGLIVDYPSSSIIRFTMTTIIGFIITRFLILPEAEWDDDEEIDRTIRMLMHGIQPDS
ncbi:TetR/AcrR family transcriptional regulator [Halobacillus campisalis]|uniref:TetR/AcrR family transcriptional regulator n=1 Tax=Halobacillus campisalis TaxID=435909 RepID=A0ABW2K6Y8_9BACI|nr:TetR/AcrR family transcriptional regulator [Halobacillus campisalis]